MTLVKAIINEGISLFSLPSIFPFPVDALYYRQRPWIGYVKTGGRLIDRERGDEINGASLEFSLFLQLFVNPINVIDHLVPDRSTLFLGLPLPDQQDSRATFIIFSKDSCLASEESSSCVTKESEIVRRQAAFFPRSFALWNSAKLSISTHSHWCFLIISL